MGLIFKINKKKNQPRAVDYVLRSAQQSFVPALFLGLLGATAEYVAIIALKTSFDVEVRMTLGDLKEVCFLW